MVPTRNQGAAFRDDDLVTEDICQRFQIPRPPIPFAMVTALELIEKLGLKPHKEGGFFSEAWRSPEKLAVNLLPPRYPGSRSLSTAIYYLLTPDTFSRMHRLRSDELFHFYLGDPVEFLLLPPWSDRDRQAVLDGEPPGRVRGPGLQYPERAAPDARSPANDLAGGAPRCWRQVRPPGHHDGAGVRVRRP